MLVLVIVLVASPVFAGEQPAFKTQLDRVNYGIGVNVIRNFKQQGIDIDLDMVIKGMKDALSGEKLIMSEGELRKIMNDFSSELRRKQAIARSMAATDNKREGEAFQAENKKKEGMVILPSGLQYQVIKASEGKKPSDADMVEFHYRGAFVNGVEFDNTYDSGKPMVVKVQEGGGIRGWSEALKLMPVGSTWRVVIPPQLAYGDKGKGRIGPNETVIFDIELLAIK
jgi:FKBP-type peptidyl-prolyl cis-trans isomerase FklB